MVFKNELQTLIAHRCKLPKKLTSKLLESIRQHADDLITFVTEETREKFVF